MVEWVDKPELREALRGSDAGVNPSMNHQGSLFGRRNAQEQALPPALHELEA